MDVSKLLVGSYIWWKAERSLKCWDVPGIVVVLNDINVTVKTFDDYKETTLNVDSLAVREEIRTSDLHEVSKYFKEKLLSKKKALLDAQHAVSICEEEIQDVQNRLKEVVDNFAALNRSTPQDDFSRGWEDRMGGQFTQEELNRPDRL